jgi:hypothetical protein
MFYLFTGFIHITMILQAPGPDGSHHSTCNTLLRAPACRVDLGCSTTNEDRDQDDNTNANGRGTTKERDSDLTMTQHPPHRCEQLLAG